MGRVRKNRVKPVPARTKSTPLRTRGTLPAPVLAPVVPTAVTERQKAMEDEIRLAAAWEAFVAKQMKEYGQSRRKVGRRLRYGSFVAGWKAAQGQ